MNTAIQAIARHVLTALGASLAAKGYTTDGDVEVAVGALLALVSVVWSAIDKARAKKALDKAIAAPAGKAE